VLGGSGPAAGSKSDEDAALLKAFDGPDRQLVARGRAAESVGKGAPSLDLKSFDGGDLPLTGAGRPVVLAFASRTCAGCGPELVKLASISVVYFKDIYVAVVAPPGDKTAVEKLIEDEGGTGLLLAGEDTSNRVAKALGVTKRPTTVVVGEKGVVDAMWSEPVPMNVLYAFLKAAYGLKKPGR
jgi:peroxiredoxin